MQRVHCTVLLVRQADVYSGTDTGRQSNLLQDVRCRSGKVVEIGTGLQSVPGEVVIEARGGALLPGLHDHHIHLFALAASLHSIVCGPPRVTSPENLAKVLQSTEGRGWIRGIDYHESVAGMLHRSQLDQWVPDRPVRIQHRSGKMWFVNSYGARILELDQHKSHTGIECDDHNEPTGRLFRMDEWLRDQLADEFLPDLRSASRMLAGLGVTGITDATPGNSTTTPSLFEALIKKGDLLQRVLLMGDDTLGSVNHELVCTGAQKILLDDSALPDFTDLIRVIDQAHKKQRCVAIHCVTRVEVVFALSALQESGVLQGDRIEHASITSAAILELIRQTGVTIVTQPHFISERGDQYAQDIDASEYDDLYRCKTFLDAGIPLGGGTDAPFGESDPWRAMQAAVHRRTRNGKILGARERLSPEQALRLFTSVPQNPGGPGRKVTIGAEADLCLLRSCWKKAREHLSRENVTATIRAGKIIFQR